MRCRAVTHAATVEGPGFPFSMADEREKQNQEEIDDRRVQDAIPPFPLRSLGRWSVTGPNPSDCT